MYTKIVVAMCTFWSKGKSIFLFNKNYTMKLGVISTQYNILMMYCRIVYLKPCNFINQCHPTKFYKKEFCYEQTSCSWMNVTMSILPKANYRFSAIPFQILKAFKNMRIFFLCRITGQESRLYLVSSFCCFGEVSEIIVELFL